MSLIEHFLNDLTLETPVSCHTIRRGFKLYYNVPDLFLLRLLDVKERHVRRYDVVTFNIHEPLSRSSFKVLIHHPQCGKGLFHELTHSTALLSDQLLGLMRAIPVLIPSNQLPLFLLLLLHEVLFD